MKYDVAIIGAGPAGSTVAKILSEKGYKILLSDKYKFPRDKFCGGGLPVKIFEKFPYLKNNDFIESYTYGGVIYSQSYKYKVQIKKDEPILGMVIRKKFDNELVKLAENDGTKFIDGKKTIDIKKTEKNCQILLDDGTKIQSEIIVGADGVWSNTAKKTGLIKNKINVSNSLYTEFFIKNEIMDKYFSKNRNGILHLKPFGLSGYGWVFPKKNHLNIGIGEINLDKNKKNKKNLKLFLKNYIELLKDSKIIPLDIKINQIKGSAIPNYPLEKTYSDRLIIIGDAAGLANPFTGEGIYNAMESARIAAETINKGFEKNNLKSDLLSEYQKKWKKEFGKDLKLFIKSARLWNKENENFIKYVSNDKKLSENLIDIVSGNTGIYKIRWKLIRRYIYCIIKDKIK